VGLLDNLGSGNIGNDASLEAMLKYLAADQRGAVLDAVCAGPQTVKDPLRRPLTRGRVSPT
jgi:polysaccharide pyruvyl transferase WcaK-like protein